MKWIKTQNGFMISPSLLSETWIRNNKNEYTLLAKRNDQTEHQRIWLYSAADKGQVEAMRNDYFDFLGSDRLTFDFSE